MDYRDLADSSLLPSHPRMTADDIIFIHVPKNAGTSIKRSLKLKMRRVGGPHYHTFDPYVEKRLEANPDAMILGVCRNPYARFWSTWKFFRHAETRSVKRLRGNDIIMYELLKGLDCSPLKFLTAINHEALWEGSPHWRPQSWYLRDRPELQIIRHISPGSLCAQLRKLIMARGGWHGGEIPTIQKLNRSEDRSDWKYHLGEEEMFMINRIYAEDFERFSYSKYE